MPESKPNGTDGLDDLLPCPFCGETPAILTDDGRMVTHACRTLDVEIRATRTAWNTRALTPDGKQERTVTARADGANRDDGPSVPSVDGLNDVNAQRQDERQDGTASPHGNDDSGTWDTGHSRAHAAQRRDGDGKLRMMHVVESHRGGIYVSQDDISDIEGVCQQRGDSDKVLGSYDTHDAASRIAINVCDALSDPDGNWLPGDGELSGYAIGMVTALSDFYDDVCDCNGIPDSDKLDSHLIAWLVRDSCSHIASMLHSTDAPRREEICDHIESTAVDAMLARLRRQGVYCDGTPADDAMISAAVLSGVATRYESIRKSGRKRDGFACMLGVTASADDTAGDIATAFIEVGIPPMILMPGDDDVWGRESSIARRIRRGARRLIGRLCDGTDANPDEVVSRVGDFLAIGSI